MLELQELCERTGVTARTVRYYIQQGLLPSPGQSGPGAKYDHGHLERLLVIRRLQQQHLPLAEIRKRLESLGDAALHALVSQKPVRASSVADYVRSALTGGPAPKQGMPRKATPQAPPAPRVERSQWERIAISTDVEIHIRRPLSRDDNRRVERLIEEAKQLMSEA
jgi:DNA-binding transcriptional MerR regulator